MGCYLAKMMGVSIGRILCGTNSNDIVHRTLSEGDMNMSDNLPTVSPAMDIQFAYNLERMIYYMANQNPLVVRTIMQNMELQYTLVGDAPKLFLDSTLLNRIKHVMFAL